MSGADRARANDTSRLKKDVYEYLLNDASAPSLILPAQKQYRGFKHPVTASLLTPAEYEDNEQYVTIKAFFSSLTYHRLGHMRTAIAETIKPLQQISYLGYFIPKVKFSMMKMIL